MGQSAGAKPPGASAKPAKPSMKRSARTGITGKSAQAVSNG